MAQSLATWRESVARSWNRLDRQVKPDHLNLIARQIAADYRAGLLDPLPMPVRTFNPVTERYEEAQS